MRHRYEPKDHIEKLKVLHRADEIIDQRQITVQSYQTTSAFKYEELNAGINSAWLAPSIKLGVFERSKISGKSEIQVVLGLQGNLSVRAYDYSGRKPLYYSWKGVIVDTVAIHYVRDEGGLIRFTTFGGGTRITEQGLNEFNETFLKIPLGTADKRTFDLVKLRDICFDRFVNQLHKIRFKDVSAKEYRSIDHTQFQSRKYIDPNVERLKEIREDPEVKIETFASEIMVTTPELVKPAAVRFEIQGLSGALRLRYPKMIYEKRMETIEEQARVFYGLVEETVKRILDEDYYAKEQLSLKEIERCAEFPEMAPTAPYKKVLQKVGERETFFKTFDLGNVKLRWLPHIKAIDELLKGDAVLESIDEHVGGFTERDPGQAVKLLMFCNEYNLVELGMIVAERLSGIIHTLSGERHEHCTEVLLAWLVKHEEKTWDIDVGTGTIKVDNLEFIAEEIDLDSIQAILSKLIGVLHHRLNSSSKDIGADLEKYQWCIEAAKALPHSQSKITSAIRLVSLGRMPKSPGDSGRILQSPVDNFPDLDEAVLDQFGLPLWPLLRSWRENNTIMLSNEGIGAALNVSFNDGDVKKHNHEFDLPSGETHILSVPENLKSLSMTFNKYGKKRHLDLPVQANADAADKERGKIVKLPKAINRQRLAMQRKWCRMIDREGTVIGSSPALLEVFEHIYNANQLDEGASVLILGETGVGKTLIAKLIHDSSKRKTGPYKEVNAGSSGGDMTIQRGEWIGLSKGHGIQGIDPNGKPGYLMAVDKGTLFVDEVALMAKGLQGIFLSVLEGRSVEQVGGASITPDVRCLSARF